MVFEDEKDAKPYRESNAEPLSQVILSYKVPVYINQNLCNLVSANETLN